MQKQQSAGKKLIYKELNPPYLYLSKDRLWAVFFIANWLDFLTILITNSLLLGIFINSCKKGVIITVLIAVFTICVFFKMKLALSVFF